MVSREFHANVLIGDTELVIPKERAELFDVAAKHLADAGLNGSINVEPALADPNSNVVRMRFDDVAAVQALLGVLGDPETPEVHQGFDSEERKTTLAA